MNKISSFANQGSFRIFLCKKETHGGIEKESICHQKDKVNWKSVQILSKAKQDRGKVGNRKSCIKILGKRR